MARQGLVTASELIPSVPPIAILEVNDPAAQISYKVQLLIDDEDWSCECASPEDPCRHVLTAAISLKKALDTGKPLPMAKAVPEAKVEYHFWSQGDHIRVKRRIVAGDDVLRELRTEDSILSVKRDMTEYKLHTGSHDIEAEQILQAAKSPLLSAIIQKRLIKALSGKPDVFHDEVPVQVVADTIRPLLRLVNEGPGIRLMPAEVTGLEKIYDGGTARIEDRLTLIEIPDLKASDRAIVHGGKYFASNEFGDLAGDIVPRLKKKFQLSIQTDRLPELTYDTPRLDLQIATSGEGAAVTARIVYGRPPIAAIVNGKLQLFGNRSPKRDLDKELRLRDRVARRYDLELGVTKHLQGQGAAEYLQNLQAKWTYGISGSGFGSFQERPPLEFNFAHVAEGIEFGFQSRDGSQTFKADPERVLQAYERGEALVPLLDNQGWSALPQDFMSRFGSLLQGLLAAKEAGRKPTAAEQLALHKTFERPDRELPPDLASIKAKLESLNPEQFKVPEDLKATLRPYQKEGAAWLDLRRQLQLGALLADDMGLGKTVQTISVMSGRVLVVAPRSVLSNWQREIENFRPHLHTAMYHGTNRSFDEGADVHLTTYGVLRLDIDQIKARQWDLIVLDEAQAIKNPMSGVTKAAHKTTAKAKIALTGTPLENSLEDLWSQFEFLNPGVLGSRTFYQKHFVRPIMAGDLDRLDQLRRMTGPYILRRLKRQVATDLPPRTDMVVYAELSEEEKDLYQTILQTTRKDILAKLEETGNVIQLLEVLLRLRQACCHPALIPGRQAETSAKIETLKEKLLEIRDEGQKALVFSQWTTLLDLIEPHLKSEGISFLRLDGRTKNRQELVDQFQDDPKVSVMIMSLKAGGVGLNLTAADHVFLMDPWWNPMIENQAADRAHRIGRTNPVFVHKLVAQGTIEENILSLQQKKLQLAEEALGVGDQLQALTKDDLVKLIEG